MLLSLFHRWENKDNGKSSGFHSFLWIFKSQQTEQNGVVRIAWAFLMVFIFCVSLIGKIRDICNSQVW